MSSQIGCLWVVSSELRRNPSAENSCERCSSGSGRVAPFLPSKGSTSVGNALLPRWTAAAYDCCSLSSHLFLILPLRKKRPIRKSAPSRQAIMFFVHPRLARYFHRRSFHPSHPPRPPVSTVLLRRRVPFEGTYGITLGARRSGLGGRSTSMGGLSSDSAVVGENGVPFRKRDSPLASSKGGEFDLGDVAELSPFVCRDDDECERANPGGGFGDSDRPSVTRSRGLAGSARYAGRMDICACGSKEARGQCELFERTRAS